MTPLNRYDTKPSLPSSLGHTTFFNLKTTMPTAFDMTRYSNELYIPTVTLYRESAAQLGRVAIPSCFFTTAEQISRNDFFKRKKTWSQAFRLIIDRSPSVQRIKLPASIVNEAGVREEIFLKADQVFRRFAISPEEGLSAYDILQKIAGKRDNCFRIFWDLHKKHSCLERRKLFSDLEENLSSDEQVLLQYMNGTSFSSLSNYFNSSMRKSAEMAQSSEDDAVVYLEEIATLCDSILSIQEAISRSRRACAANYIALTLLWHYSQGDHLPLERIVKEAQLSDIKRLLDQIKPYLLHYSSIFGYDLLALELWAREGLKEEKREEAVQRIVLYLDGTQSHLDLSDLSLNELPPIFGVEGYFDELQSLDLSLNNIRSLPCGFEKGCPKITKIDGLLLS